MQHIVHILKKGPLYWRSNHSHCPKQLFETLLSQCLTFITLDSLESTILLGWQSSGHVLPSPPPPQRTTAPSGSMLNQHVDFSLTCIWTHGLYWEYCLTSFLPEIVPAVLDFTALGNPLATVWSTAIYWLMELMKTSDTAAMACQISSPV